MNNEIKVLQVAIDNLMVQTAINSVRLNVLTSMVLGVYKETMPNEQYKNIYTNYVNAIDQEASEALNGISEILFDQGAFAIRQKFDHFLAIAEMKLNESYLGDSNS